MYRNKSLDSQVNALNGIFEELNDQAYEYCVLRNFKELPVHVGNDLDLFVSDDALEPIVDLVINVMNLNDFKLVKKTERFGHVGLYFIHTETAESLVVDLLTRCVKFWYDYADKKYILKERIRYKNFYVPTNGIILYTVVLKDLLTYGRVREKNDEILRSIHQGDLQSFLRCGEEYVSPKLLELLFNECLSESISIKRSKLLLNLQKSFSLSNAVIYSYYRLKEIFIS